MFPNHIPNPENEGNGLDLRGGEGTKKDLGVIFDTDVDRGAVDHQGEEINRNRLVAVASAIGCSGGHEGGTIVTDSITSAD